MPSYYEFQFFVTDFEQANASRCESQKLIELVKKLRQGCSAARAALQEGLRWLTYDVTASFVNRMCRTLGPNHRFEQYIGSAHIALFESIKRLALNRNSDAERFVRNAIWHELRAFAREDARSIYPPSSTQATRKKAQKAPYQPLRRNHSANIWAEKFADERRSSESIVEHPKLPNLTQSGQSYRRPSKYWTDTDPRAIAEANELLDTYCKSPLERRFAELALEGHKLSKIREELGLTGTELTKLRARMRKPAKRRGADYTGRGRRLAFLCTTTRPAAVRPAPLNVLPSGVAMAVGIDLQTNLAAALEPLGTAVRASVGRKNQNTPNVAV